MARSTMTCNAARQALWPDPTGPADPVAWEHYQSCPACRRFFADQRVLGGRLSALRDVPIPAGLRERVLAALDTQAPMASAAGRDSRRRSWFLGIGLAAAAGLVLALGLADPGTDALRKPLVSEAARALTPPATFRSSDPGAIETWLGQHIGRPVSLPDIAGARIVGGRVVNIAGVPAAAAVYEKRGVPLTYFVFAGYGTDAVRMSEFEVVSTGAAGYQVALWKEPAGLRALAARMPSAEVRAVAAACRAKAAAGI